MGTKLHRIELYVYNTDDSESSIEDFEANVLNSVDGYYYDIGIAQTIDVGEWCDDHPLNQTSTTIFEIMDLFRKDDPATFCEEEAIINAFRRIGKGRSMYSMKEVEDAVGYPTEKFEEIAERMRHKGLI